MSFSPGSIVKITLTDFMSFKYAHLECGPKLNLIVGANGSGKSSLACAIVLGLGGKPNILERASNVNEFIRRGCVKSEIEIELFHPDGNIIISRTLMRDLSTWHINKEFVTFKDVDELMKKLSIHVDNMCQFLPQDRLLDFAKMNKQELLLNTLNSVGSKFLAETYQMLLEFTKFESKFVDELKNCEERLNAAKEIFSRTSKAVECAEDRKKMLAKIELLQQKKAWLRYCQKKDNLIKNRKLKKNKEIELKKVRKHAEPFINEIDKLKKLLKEVDEKIARYKIAENEEMGKFRSLLQSIQHWDAKILLLKADFKIKVKENDRRLCDIANLKNAIEELNFKIEALQDNNLEQQICDIQIKIDEVTGELRKLTEEEYQAQKSAAAAYSIMKQTEYKISIVNNIEMKKLIFLQQKNITAYRIREYVKSNSDIFCGKIYGPTFFELKIESINYARYIEAAIPYRDMVAFICEDSRDVTKLVKYCKKEDLLINVFVAPQDNGPVKKVYQPDIHIENLSLERQQQKYVLIQEHYENMKHKRSCIESERNELFYRKKSCIGAIDQLQINIKKRETALESLDQLEAKRFNLLVEDQDKKIKIKRIIHKMMRELQMSPACLRSLQNIFVSKKLHMHKIELIDKKLAKEEEEFKDIKKKIKAAEADLKEFEIDNFKLKEEVGQLYSSAKCRTDNLSYYTPLFEKLYGFEFRKLPNNIEQINDEIYEMSARIECLELGIDPQAITDYEVAKEEIKLLEKLKSSATDDFSNKKKIRDKLKAEWNFKMNKLINKINSKFSLFFEKIGYAGEVELCCGNDENDFSSYGLIIRVKFRNSESLQELNRYLQSGGERSVSIAVYMLALQELTRFPFRCVDELNQGMDEVNERQIYRLLLQTIDEASMSQYFLITPKLLKNLVFTRDVIVHTIYNGMACITNDHSEKVMNFLKHINAKHEESIASLKRKRVSNSDDE
ncbi:structural maintenance of chromosomes 5 isoform X2 [Lycorma delicatula]|uniref:structural maintenance of chromosomes 5 isoform X2 n=1 Tax=Lycorma delicatula TaxID=130591 RepID=UPI003F517223